MTPVSCLIESCRQCPESKIRFGIEDCGSKGYDGRVDVGACHIILSEDERAELAIKYVSLNACDVFQPTTPSLPAPPALDTTCQKTPPSGRTLSEQLP
jgi:hypothetical protein